MAASDPALERWNNRFAAPGFVFGTAPNAFLASQAHRLKRGASALCVADGEVDEGAGHKGMSALVDLVARRPG